MAPAQYATKTCQTVKSGLILTIALIRSPPETKRRPSNDRCRRSWCLESIRLNPSKSLGWDCATQIAPKRPQSPRESGPATSTT
ncbi:hypothetical protein PM082_016227 [Marasmius tenuissimus]|nr:hypothetical protein PM082_016227 [Marasmius tenuissimus]